MVNSSLNDLHDIILPHAPAEWPPALGAWLVAIFLIGIAVAGICAMVREFRRRLPIWHARRAALDELETIANASGECVDTQLQSARLMALLRRCTLLVFPRETCAGLTGSAWFEFLDRHAPAPFLTTPAGAHWLDVPYERPAGLPTSLVFNELVGYTERWIRHNLRGGRR